MEYQLYLRPVCEQDLEIIHSWNLNPLIINQFNLPDNKPNSWGDTLAWWKGLGSSLVFVVIVIDSVQSATYWNGRPIGLAWVKNIRSELPEIGGYIGDTDYYQKSVVEMYNLTMDTINQRKGIQRACLKIKREEQSLIGMLSGCGWRIDNETDGMVELRYG
jgi:RimJ/RimL family protein N-acetyltransferase